MMCSTLYVRNHETATSIQTLHVSARSIVQDFVAIRHQRITEMRMLLMYYTMFWIVGPATIKFEKFS